MTRNLSGRMSAGLLAAGACPTIFGGVIFFLEGSPENEVFRSAGFLTLRPAIAYHAPGTFNTVEQQSQDAVILQPTCEIDLRDFENRIIKTDTVSSTINRKLSLGYDLEEAKWQDVALPIKLDAVKNIRVSFANSKVWMLPTETVWEIRETYLKGSCLKAIVRELKSGLKVCQSKSVVVSDVVYSVSYDAGASLGVKQLSSNSGAGQVRETKGERIFHAVKLEPHCLLLNEGLENTATQGPDKIG